MKRVGVDASAYVALAAPLGADLVTLDEGIAAACAQAAER